MGLPQLTNQPAIVTQHMQNGIPLRSTRTVQTSLPDQGERNLKGDSRQSHNGHYIKPPPELAPFSGGRFNVTPFALWVFQA